MRQQLAGARHASGLGQALPEHDSSLDATCAEALRWDWHLVSQQLEVASAVSACCGSLRLIG